MDGAAPRRELTAAAIVSDDTATLVAKAQAGDASAFCELVAEHEKRLYRQALVMCRGQHAAEDLVQETMVEAWKSLGRYTHACRLGAWLYAILLHRYRKMLRQARRRPTPFGALTPMGDDDGGARVQDRLESEEPDPREAALRNDARQRLRGRIDAMPPKLRDVVLLRFFGDASLAEIATVLDVPLGTVKSRLHNGLEKLRQMMRGE